MPDRVKPRYYGMPVSPVRVAELAQEHGGLPERVGRHPALAGDRLAQFGCPGRRGTPGRVSEGSRMVPDGGIRACDRERTQDPDGKRSAPGREQREPEFPHAAFGRALLDCPPLCRLPRWLRALLLAVLALSAHPVR